MKYVLHLFVKNRMDHAHELIQYIQKMCENELGENYELRVIDVLENPQFAGDEKVLATPMLVKHEPPPKIKVFGDLTQTGAVMSSLNLKADEPPKEISA